MKKALLFLTLFLTSCGIRTIPPEITAIHDDFRAPPQRGEHVIIDAGHGGHDPGCISRRENYEEKSLTLKTALLVEENLKKLGYRTTLTRTQDVFLSLNKRAEIANELDADLFVSIHYNHSFNKEAEGIEVYYYKTEKKNERIAKSRELANKVLNSVCERSLAKSRGVKEANFAVIRETKMPAILIEAGFLSNVQEKQKLHDPAYLRQLSWAIAKGVDKYLH